MKKEYIAPKLTVVTFRPEQGFAVSGTPQDVLFDPSTSESDDNTASSYSGSNWSWDW